MSLGDLQAEVLRALADGHPTDRVVAAALGAAPDAEVTRWVEGWDPDLVALAGELVRTWGRRST